MLVALLIIPHSAFLRQLPGVFEQNAACALRRHLGGKHTQFDGIHRLAHVSAAGRRDLLRHAVLDHQRRFALLLQNGVSTLYSPQHLLRLHRSELKDSGTAQYGVVYIEIWIFRCGRNQCDTAVLQKFQQRLLLLFVEILDLIEIQQNTVNSVKTVQSRHYLADVGGGGCGAIELDQLFLRLLRDNRRERCLSHARRAVKNQIRDGAGLDDPTQRLAGCEQMALADNLIERLRTNPIRKRRSHILFPFSLYLRETRRISLRRLSAEKGRGERLAFPGPTSGTIAVYS